MVKDRRVSRTQKAMKTALLQLMEKKSVNSISVTELCELADLNRSTFYDYYHDIYELLHAVHLDLFEAMNVYVKASQQAAEQQNHDAQQAFIASVIEYMKTNNHLFQTLWKRSKEYDFEQQLFQYFSSQLIIQQKDPLSNTTQCYEFLYHCAGSFAILRQWILDDCPLSSLQLAQIIMKSIQDNH